MKRTYTVAGMTCNGCAASVTKHLSKLSGVRSVHVDLKKKEALITIDHHIPLPELQSVLPKKFTIGDKVHNTDDEHNGTIYGASKLKQLKPLLLIFAYLFAAVFLLNYKDRDVSGAMLDFMGLFYIVFSFFKLLDLKGFPESFRMYDPLAKMIPAYGRVYPFIELALGSLFLMRFQVGIALVGTIVVLGITTIGVARALLDKKNIRCACLGTALKLPMTEATFIENSVMLGMAFFMLIKIYF